MRSVEDNNLRLLITNWHRNTTENIFRWVMANDYTIPMPHLVTRDFTAYTLLYPTVQLWML